MSKRTKWLWRVLSGLWLGFGLSLMAVFPAQAVTYLAESDSDDGNWGPLALFLLGPIVYGLIYAIYRNPDARHKYESETDVKIDHLEQTDQLVERRTRTRDSKLPGANSTQLRGNPLNSGR